MDFRTLHENKLFMSRREFTFEKRYGDCTDSNLFTERIVDKEVPMMADALAGKSACMTIGIGACLQPWPGAPIPPLRRGDLQLRQVLEELQKDLRVAQIDREVGKGKQTELFVPVGRAVFSTLIKLMALTLTLGKNDVLP